MNLISCNNCGVVLDEDKLSFPLQQQWIETNPELFEWNGDKYVSSARCPVCEERIWEE